MSAHVAISMDEADSCAPRVLTSQERIGLLCTALASLCSLATVVVLFVQLGIQAIRNTRLPLSKRRHILCTHLDLYVLFLLLADVMQAIPEVLTFHWVRLGFTSCGQVCTAQAVLKLLAYPGTSMLTLAIAVHTFCIIVLQWIPPPSFTIPSVVIAATWIYRAVFLGAAKAAERAGFPLFTPTPYWCWISEHYAAERVPVGYLWHWLCVGISAALYVPLFLYIRGNLDVDPARPWRVALHRAAVDVRPLAPGTGRFSLSKQSRKMLLYPAVYVVLIVPFSAMRWADNFAGEGAIAPPWYFLCVSLYYLGGLANVLLLMLTRPSLLGFARLETREETHSESKTYEGGLAFSQIEGHLQDSHRSTVSSQC